MRLMRATLTILLFSLLLYGCSQKHTLSADDLAMILVPTGQYITFHDGYVLYVEKRDGTTIQNITVYKTTSDGDTTTTHADTGTVLLSLDDRSLKLTLQDARSVSGSNITTNKELILVLHD
jgi:hypothetical protein